MDDKDELKRVLGDLFNPGERPLSAVRDIAEALSILHSMIHALSWNRQIGKDEVDRVNALIEAIRQKST